MGFKGRARPKNGFDGACPKKKIKEKGVERILRLKVENIAGVTYLGEGGGGAHYHPNKFFFRGIMWLKLVSWGVGVIQFASDTLPNPTGAPLPPILLPKKWMAP